MAVTAVKGIVVLAAGQNTKSILLLLDVLSQATTFQHACSRVPFSKECFFLASQADEVD